MSFFNSIIAKALPYIPKQVVRRVSRRYIAGTALQDAMRVIRDLERRGMMATLDILGEDVHERSAAQLTKDEWRRVLEEIRSTGVKANISVKLSQIGLRIDKEFCVQNLRSIADTARQRGNFVRIDMEDSSTTSANLEIYRKLRSEGFENVGVVIQAYLRRSDADVRELVKTKANIRLCKGIYIESPDIAFQDRDEIRRNFILLLRTIVENGSYVGIATHDDYLIEKSYELIQRSQVPQDRYEFQMLLGVREGLRRSIVEDRHRLRVYVPYGEQWYAYSVRRLKENPQIVGYVLKAMLSGNHS